MHALTALAIAVLIVSHAIVAFRWRGSTYDPNNARLSDLPRKLLDKMPGRRDIHGNPKAITHEMGMHYLTTDYQQALEKGIALDPKYHMMAIRLHYAGLLDVYGNPTPKAFVGFNANNRRFWYAKHEEDVNVARQSGRVFPFHFALERTLRDSTVGLLKGPSKFHGIKNLDGVPLGPQARLPRTIGEQKSFLTEKLIAYSGLRNDQGNRATETVVRFYSYRINAH